MSEKQDLTLDELEAQMAVELPERELMCSVTQTTTVRNTNNNTNTASATGISITLTLTI